MPKQAERFDMSVDLLYRKSKYGNDIQVLLVPGTKAKIATELLSRWGMVAGKPDGEDSAGRAKLALMPVEEVVTRAVEAADLAVNEMKKRGWFLEIPPQEEEE